MIISRERKRETPEAASFAAPERRKGAPPGRLFDSGRGPFRAAQPSVAPREGEASNPYLTLAVPLAGDRPLQHRPQHLLPDHRDDHPSCAYTHLTLLHELILHRA